MNFIPASGSNYEQASMMLGGAGKLLEEANLHTEDEKATVAQAAATMAVGRALLSIRDELQLIRKKVE